MNNWHHRLPIEMKAKSKAGPLDACWTYLVSKAARKLDRKAKVAHLVSLGMSKATAYCQTQRFEVCNSDRKAAALYGRGKSKAEA